MQALPHHYTVLASGSPRDDVWINAEALDKIAAAPPLEFDGPGDKWSPETLLLAAVSSCMLLSFRAVARAANFDWISLDCQSKGRLDREDRTTQFTRIINRVDLVVPEGTDVATAEKLLHKAERNCLISNSLNSDVELDCKIEFQPDTVR